MIADMIRYQSKDSAQKGLVNSMVSTACVCVRAMCMRLAVQLNMVFLGREVVIGSGGRNGNGNGSDARQKQ